MKEYVELFGEEKILKALEISEKYGNKRFSFSKLVKYIKAEKIKKAVVENKSTAYITRNFKVNRMVVCRLKKEE